MLSLTFSITQQDECPSALQNPLKYLIYLILLIVSRLIQKINRSFYRIRIICCPMIKTLLHFNNIFIE